MLSEQQAIALADSGFWTSMSAIDIATFQFAARRLCMPFSVFHKAVEEALGRPVWTHEFGLNWTGLLEELRGERAAPTMDEIMALIPEEKRIIVAIGGDVKGG